MLSRDDILNDLRGHEAELYTRAVDIVVSRLRKKLEPLDAIKTLRNAGYTLALRRAICMRRKLAGRHAGQASWHRARVAVHCRCGCAWCWCFAAGAGHGCAPSSQACKRRWRGLARGTRPAADRPCGPPRHRWAACPALAGAQAITACLPIALRISGPAVNWDSQLRNALPRLARDPAWRQW